MSVVDVGMLKGISTGNLGCLCQTSEIIRRTGLILVSLNYRLELMVLCGISNLPFYQYLESLTSEEEFYSTSHKVHYPLDGKASFLTF